MRALRLALGLLAAVPALAAVPVLLVVPPVADAVPDAVVGAARPLAAPAFAAVERIPPDSPLGRAFYGTFAALAPAFGGAALAAHALLLALPFAALAAALLASARRPASPG